MSNSIQSLSKRERSFQFIYLLALLLFSLVLLNMFFFKNFDSPFSKEISMEMQLLDQKNLFNKQQKILEPNLEAVFNKISILKDETPQPFIENDIIIEINAIANSFNNSEVFDPRKEAYTQIAYFFKMYFEDKKIAAKKNENIKLFKKQFEECSIGFKDKEQQLAQKKTAMLNR
jgi:hypothetical protein